MATRLNAPFPICGGTVFNVVSPATGTLYTLDGRGSALFNDVDVPYFLTQGYSQAASGGGGGGGTVTQVNTGTGLSGGPILSSGTIALANTPVVPGTYMNTNLTVDAQGRITSAGNGSGGAGGGTVTNVATGPGLKGGPITITGTLDLADVPTATIKGRIAGGTGPPTDLTGTQVTTLLDAFTSSLKGLVPPSGGGTTNFLRADGTFAAPPGGGGGGGGTVTSVGSGTGLTGGPITGAGTLALANTPVVPGPYTSANITIDAQGRITTAANGSGGGTFSAVGSPIFGRIGDAQAAVIPSNVTAVRLMGYNIAGDGGAGDYVKVSGLASLYTGNGSVQQTPPVPPGFASGGLPFNVFSTTDYNHLQPNPYGPLLQPIQAGCLTVILVSASQDSPPSTIVDDVGNTYTLAANEPTYASLLTSCAVYYCANPVFAPMGTYFTITGNPDNVISLDVYCVPGFTGAVLDQVTGVATGSSVSTMTLTTGALSTSQEFALAIVNCKVLPEGATSSITFTVPGGWYDISPPKFGRPVIACTAVNSTSAVTFSTTWSGKAASPASGILLTFKTFPLTAMSPAYWQLQPTFPLHTAQYGITPSAGVDNAWPFAAFNRWYASVLPPSSSTHGYAPPGPGVQSAIPVAISIANPAVVAIGPNPRTTFNVLPLIRNSSFVSFSTTGTLPTGIVAGQIYYAQYGTVAFDIPSGVLTFQISATSIFLDPAGFQTTAKGVPIVTSGSQSGTHYMTTYGDGWTDIQLDPGLYYCGNNNIGYGFLGFGTGIKKVRVNCYGARTQSGVLFGPTPWADINSTTGWTGWTFSAPFQSTAQQIINHNDTTQQITLNTPALASQFYINSWVLLMCCELQGGTNTAGNWNQAIFEYQRVKSADASTGVIIFYDQLQYNYRSTFPKFAPSGSAPVDAFSGPARIVQLSDTFDQEIEYRGLNIYGVSEANCSGVVSMKFIDCDIYGWGYKTGPFPSTMREFSMINCRTHSSNQEIDKMIDTVNLVDCVFDADSALQIQSATINKFVMERCRMSGGIGGTARDVTVRDSYVAGKFFFGCVLGGTERITLINSHINEIRNGAEGEEFMRLSVVTFSNGTIKIPVGTSDPGFGTWNGTSVASDCPLKWAIPGAKIGVCFPTVSLGAGSRSNSTMAGMLAAFTVLNVYVDGSDAFCVDTTMPALPSSAITVTATIAGTAMTVTAISPSTALLMYAAVVTGGGLPVGTTITNGPGIPGSSIGVYTISNSATVGSPTTFTVTIADMFFLAHMCPRLNVINCTGGRMVTDMAGAPPDIPIYSYFKRAFSGFAMNTYINPAYVPLCGNLTSLTINVLKPYTGSAGSYTLAICLFGFAQSGSNYYPTYSLQTVDLTVKGLRTISTGSPIGSVGADSMSAVTYWLTGEHQVVIGPTQGGGDTLAQQPVVVVTGNADQGIDFANMTLTTVTSGLDELADTVSGFPIQ